MKPNAILVRYLAMVFILELAGAGGIVVGLFTLRQSQVNYTQALQETRAVQMDTAATRAQVQAIIDYVNTSAKNGYANNTSVLNLLGTLCVLLVDVDQRADGTPTTAQKLSCNLPFQLPPATIPSAPPAAVPPPVPGRVTPTPSPGG